MAAPGRTTGPVVSLIMLLLVAGAATRGYLPGGDHVARRPAAPGPLEPIILAALLAVSVGAVAVAVVQRARHRRAVPGSMGTLSATAGAHRGRPAWRVLLIGLAAVAVWLLAVMVLARWGRAHRFAIPAGFFGQRGEVPASPNAPETPAPAPLHPLPDGARGEVFGYLLMAAAVLLVLVAAAVVLARARRAGSPKTGTLAAAVRAPSPGETLARAAELGLSRIVDPRRGPREAIIACYAVMERHLADVPDAAPREFDTPTEVLARAVEHHALPAENASRLVELFTEARFSPHLMTERHRSDAVAILRLVLDELRGKT